MVGTCLPTVVHVPLHTVTHTCTLQISCLWPLWHGGSLKSNGMILVNLPVPASTCLLEQTVWRQGLTHFSPGLVGAHCVLALNARQFPTSGPSSGMSLGEPTCPAECLVLSCSVMAWPECSSRLYQVRAPKGGNSVSSLVYLEELHYLCHIMLGLGLNKASPI